MARRNLTPDLRNSALGTIEEIRRVDTPKLPKPNFAHLEGITSPIGMWEHCKYSTPRVEHGFCTDDNARGLILLGRESRRTSQLDRMYQIYLRFLENAALPSGAFQNRRKPNGDWTGETGSDDSIGRGIWASGSVARRGQTAAVRNRGLRLFESRVLSSPSPRANAFAILGAADVLAIDPDHRIARRAVERWLGNIVISDDAEWPWPESRLAYDNARIPEALMKAGLRMADEKLVQSGLALLEWLVSVEINGDHFSFTPVRGWAVGENRPGYDQQPLEAAAISDACYTAWRVTGEDRWKERVRMAGGWFVGDNDGEFAMYDPQTGGGYDGLTPEGPNLNQGAESTLSALSALQRAASVGQ